MALKIHLSSTQYFDINNDGYINGDDLIDMLLMIFHNDTNHDMGDFNFDSKVNIFDLILFCEYLYN